MSLKINKDYLKYCCIAMALLLDAALLLFIKNNVVLSVLYFILNIVLISIYCFKLETEDSAIFSIIFMLFYTFFIDVFIHYFHKIVLFEAEFLFVLPILITCFKIKKFKPKLFLIITGIYLLLNTQILFIAGKVDTISYALFIPNIISFLGFYYIYSNINGTSKLKDLFKFIFIISFILTIGQTIVGFNEDTRNGLFSVFGWGAYTFFIMIFLMYNLKQYLDKKSNIISLIISIVLSCVLYLCTESKAAFVFVIINIVLLIVIGTKFSKKKLIFLLVGVLLIPVSYKVLIYFTPKFSHLNSPSQIIRYFTGNNNPRYEYGRFEAMGNVFKENSLFEKTFGIGFGGSCPLYKVYFEELGRQPKYPYYTKKYGYLYGYQHTSSAILLLDGGIILFVLVIAFLLYKLYMTLKNIKIKDNNTIDCIRFGVLIYLLYFFTYANVLKDFRIMGLLGIVLGLKVLENDKQQDRGDANV